MTKKFTSLTVGTRTSKLALWQTHNIIEQLQNAWPGLTCQIEDFITKGDKTLDKPLPQIGGKGLFTAELEEALRDGRIDIAIHSLKDLPVADAPGLTLGAITNRAPVQDGLVARDGHTLDTLPQGAKVGTSSNRRRAQLLSRRPDLQVESIRGNVETRIRKVMEDGLYDATVLARAGLERLNLTDLVSEWLTLEVMLPAPGQAALAVQCRADDEATLELLSAIDDEVVRTAVTAERTFLFALGGGCSAPIAAYAYRENGVIQMNGLIGATDGRQLIRVNGRGSDPHQLGRQLAQKAKEQGAEAILANLQSPIPNPQSPLTGKRIVVTRSPEQAETYAQKLAALGAAPIVVPAIRFDPMPTEPLDEALQQLDQFDWLVFTSGNAVKFFFRRFDELFPDPAAQAKLPPIAATGSATAKKLAARGLTPDFVPDEFVGEELVRGLGDVDGRRVLLPRAKIGRPKIVEMLNENGAEVDDIPLYDTVTAAPNPAALTELRSGVDVITFTSPSSVRNFLQILETHDLADLPRQPDVVIACIGPITAQQAEDLDLLVHVAPDEYTINGMTQAIIQYFEERKDGG